MSYDIIKRIKVKDNKVLILHAPNNVRPRTYSETESFTLSKIFQEEGKEALELEILRAFEEGNFQSYGKNKYTNAVIRLKHMPEYKTFNWRLPGLGKDYETMRKNRENKIEFNKILLKALKSKFPTDEFIISKDDFNGKIVYLFKITKARAMFTYDKAKAKVYHYKDDCERLKECFTGADIEWRIEQIK